MNGLEVDLLLKSVNLAWGTDLENSPDILANDSFGPSIDIQSIRMEVILCRSCILIEVISCGGVALQTKCFRSEEVRGTRGTYVQLGNHGHHLSRCCNCKHNFTSSGSPSKRRVANPQLSLRQVRTLAKIVELQDSSIAKFLAKIFEWQSSLRLSGISCLITPDVYSGLQRRPQPAQDPARTAANERRCPIPWTVEVPAPANSQWQQWQIGLVQQMEAA